MIVVSVASGTSVDGLDVGVVDLTLDGDCVTAEVLDSRTEPWPDGLRERLLALLPPGGATAAELCALDTAVGQAVGAVATAAAERAGGADLVVSPGQTVHHEIEGDRCLGTLQIGQPAWVAEATGLPVVSDLRTRDVAAGGHGAPLAGVLDTLWLAGGSGPRVALNLGGIANVTVVRSDGTSLAWDTGPANCLLDVAASRASGGELSYDVNGALASRGRVLPDLLNRLLAHPHYALTPPVSTGRETFSAEYLDRMVGPEPAWEDVAATLVELTARTVTDALAPPATPRSWRRWLGTCPRRCAPATSWASPSTARRRCCGRCSASSPGTAYPSPPTPPARRACSAGSARAPALWSCPRPPTRPPGCACGPATTS